MSQHYWDMLAAKQHRIKLVLLFKVRSPEEIATSSSAAVAAQPPAPPALVDSEALEALEPGPANNPEEGASSSSAVLAAQPPSLVPPAREVPGAPKASEPAQLPVPAAPAATSPGTQLPATPRICTRSLETIIRTNYPSCFQRSPSKCPPWMRSPAVLPL